MLDGIKSCDKLCKVYNNERGKNTTKLTKGTA